MSSTSRERIASGLRRSLRIVARHRSTCGAPMLSLPPPTAAALPRSCAGPVNRSRWCGPGRRGSWRRASKGCCATRRATLASPRQRVVDLALGPRRRLKRGVFRSVADLQATINRFVEETNSDPKPFVWTADPKRVLAAVKRGKKKVRVDPLESRVFDLDQADGRPD